MLDLYGHKTTSFRTNCFILVWLFLFERDDNLFGELQGESKGVVVESLIATMRTRGKVPDFVLCVGDDRSDEDMFESIARSVTSPSLPTIAEVFACTVGQKPSVAKYYLDDTFDVIKMLQGVASASGQINKPALSQVSFEGPP